MTQTIILAAGKSTRMKSKIPKPLIPAAGIPMISRVVSSVTRAHRGAQPIIVIDGSARGKAIRRQIGRRAVFAIQRQQKGTAHALLSARQVANRTGTIVVVSSDHPFITSKTLTSLIRTHRASASVISMVGFRCPSFSGMYAALKSQGRIKTNARGHLEKIVEAKDATLRERRIRFVNAAIYCFSASWLWKSLPQIKNNNAKKEYYLIDLIEIALKTQQKVGVTESKHLLDCLGINTPEQLDIAERIFYTQSNTGKHTP